MHFIYVLKSKHFLFFYILRWVLQEAINYKSSRKRCSRKVMHTSLLTVKLIAWKVEDKKKNKKVKNCSGYVYIEKNKTQTPEHIAHPDRVFCKGG